ncbi:hypothetical protein [Aureimonas mangrovi]|uniref:hypothetical protein n=1 Tax=Aureimonas mangrovi TaxID=2758041 RepID=UPI00163D5BCB|nr:hypothetical protein [Aureimonas mangrovi]
MSKVGQNPNDKLPDGKPLEPDRVVSEDDAGSAEIEKEVQDERAADGGSDEEALRRADGDEEQPGLA